MKTKQDNGLKVGYILKRFPRLSETFILNELLELERQGSELSVYSLYYPDDGRFHGRMAELKLTAEYFPAEKPELMWSRLQELAPEIAPSLDCLPEANDFVKRYDFPKQLDMLLRAALIGARARQQGVQHLHAHFATIATRMAALVNIMTGIPFSFTAHAKDIFRETVNRELFAELVNRSAFAVTVSDFNREYILDRTPGADPSKLHRLYNGIDLGFFENRGARPVAEIPHIVSVGRLVPKKGFGHLLQAIRLCKEHGLELRATIIGDGEGMAELVALRNRLGLDAQVELTGALPQEEVREHLAGSSMVALACTHDSDGNADALPTVLLEALALGRPIVSTRLSGIPEIVGQDAGILTEPGDEPGFAAALAELWGRIQNGTVNSETIRGRAENLFDVRVNVSTLRELFVASARRLAA